MAEDPRSCGSSACIVNADGCCWCGLKWDGRKMSRVPLENPAEQSVAKTTKTAGKARRKSPGKTTRTRP